MKRKVPIIPFPNGTLNFWRLTRELSSKLSSRQTIWMCRNFWTMPASQLPNRFEENHQKKSESISISKTISPKKKWKESRKKTSGVRETKIPSHSSKMQFGPKCILTHHLYMTHFDRIY